MQEMKEIGFDPWVGNEIFASEIKSFTFCGKTYIIPVSGTFCRSFGMRFRFGLEDVS